MYIFTGETAKTAAKTDQILNSWKNDETGAIIFMTKQKGGIGLNLQECADIIILEPHWNPYVCYTLYSFLFAFFDYLFYFWIWSH